MLKRWLEDEFKVTLVCVCISVAALVLSALGWLEGYIPFDPAWAAVILCGFPIIAEAVRALVTEHNIKADLLVSMALIASLIVSDFFEAGEVGLIMKIGSLLEEYTVRRARRGMSEDVDTGGAEIVRIADRWATWMVLIALTCAVITGIVSREFIRAVTVMVVFCPCGFILAAPTSVAAAIGNLANYGIIVRSADALERLGEDKSEALSYDKGRVSYRDYGIAVAGEGESDPGYAAAPVIVENEENLPFLFEMSKKMMGKIKQNMVLSIIINLIAVVLSAAGILTPFTGAIFHNCGSLFVVVNAATLLFVKKK